MDYSFLLIVLTGFVFAMSLGTFLWLFFAESRYLQQRTIKHRLMHMSAKLWHGREKITLFREQTLKDANLLVKLVYKLPKIDTLERLIIASGFSLNPSLVIMGCFMAVIISSLAGYIFYQNIYGAIGVGGVTAFLPVIFFKVRVSYLRKKFLEQFPDALDLLARALRSGIALSGAMSMVAAEADKPLKDEFASVVDEINFGLTMKDAFNNMCERMPVTELQFFSIAVLIHREVGGNIAEIVDNIGRLIRERIKFKRTVRVLTGEGRISGMILLLLPVIVFFYLYLVNYDYVALLWQKKIGQYLLSGAVLLQVVGALVIKKMIAIDI